MQRSLVCHDSPNLRYHFIFEFKFLNLFRFKHDRILIAVCRSVRPIEIRFTKSKDSSKTTLRGLIRGGQKKKQGESLILRFDDRDDQN